MSKSPESPSPHRERVAVIGSGVAGLTAAYLLQRRYDVVLLEADARLGGHAHTHTVATADAGKVEVDSGFIVHNRVTYPNLVRLFDELGVATQPSDMSMSVRCNGCGLEYAGALGLRGVFASPKSAVRLAYLRMLLEVNKFYRQARPVASQTSQINPGDKAGIDMTLGEFLDRGGFSLYFRRHFMVPVVSAVWSVAPETALEYPARYLFAFMANHGMLSVGGSHQWYTLVGGSRSYVEAAVKGVRDVRLSAPVKAVSPHAPDASGGRSVTVRFADGSSEVFDRVVVATHPDQALSILQNPTEAQRRVLGAFRYSRNEVTLHKHPDVLPRRSRARASWNYLLDGCDAGGDRALVSYDMNRLSSLATTEPHIVTLNCDDRIPADRVIARMVYEHPIYTPESVKAQAALGGLNDGTIAFAGAYHGWGFHEDGCRAGVAAAASFGVSW